MTYRGTVRNGIVQLEEGALLADGTPVEVQPIERTSCRNDDERPLLKYAKLARRTGLPSDFSAQHDHYIHGAPRR